MSQVKDFLKQQTIKHTYITVNVVDGHKMLDARTAPEGYKVFKKSYEEIIELNNQVTDRNTIGIDTKKYHQLDCDNEEIFNKYFGNFNLKATTPYYLSVHKKLPHYFVKIINLPLGFDRKALKWGTDTFCDVLVGQWAWCHMNAEIINADKEIFTIDFECIKEIDSRSKIDFSEDKKDKKQKNKLKEQKQKEEERRQKREIKDLKKKKPNRRSQAKDHLKSLLKKSKTVTISRRDNLLLEMLPSELADDRDKWINIGYIIYNMYENNYDEGLRRFKRFSKLSKKYDPSKIEQEYASFKNSRKQLTIATADYYLKEVNEDLYEVYKLICECLDFKFRDQDLANMFYQLFKEDYVCAYFKPDECWYKYEDGMYHELDGKALIENLMPILGKKLLDYEAVLEYAVEIFKNLENESSYDDPDIKYFIESQKFYDELLTNMYSADDYCNNSYGQSNIYKCCRVAFYKHEFLDLLNQKLNLLCFGKDVLDTKLIKNLEGQEIDITKIFRESTKDDYVSIKTGMTKEQCFNADNDIVNYLNSIGKVQKNLVDYLGENKSFAEKYLKVALPHPGQYEYVLTLLSDSIYGKNRQRFCVNMGIGKNMKSVLQSLMQNAFGDYFGTMKPSYITAKDDEKTSSLDSDLYSCMYKRSLWISEPPENKSLNGSRMKTLAGNDIMKVREIYKKSEEFMPQFSIYISCNTTFKLDPCSDISLPRRIKFNKFTQFFTNKVDPNNPTHSQEDPLIKDDYFTLLLSRSLMKILIEHYIKIDLLDPTHEVEDMEPEVCKEWKAEFIVSGDSFEDFFNENYMVTLDQTHEIVNNLLYTDYVKYCRDNQYRSLNKYQFFNKLQLKFSNPKLYYSTTKTLGIIEYTYGDSFMSFIDTCYEVTNDLNDEVINCDIFEQYIIYCKEEYFKPLNNFQFFSKIKSLFEKNQQTLFCFETKTVGLRMKELEIEEPLKYEICKTVSKKPVLCFSDDEEDD